MSVCAHSVVINQYYLFCCVERSGNIPGRESIVVDLTALGKCEQRFWLHCCGHHFLL